MGVPSMGILKQITEHAGSSATALSLAAVTFLGGCSQAPTQESFKDSGPTTAIGNKLEALTGPGIDRARELVSLTDPALHGIRILPGKNYVIEIPAGTFAEIRGAVTDIRSKWTGKVATDESLIFTVPSDPENYAIRVHRHEYCTHYKNRPDDGTYVELLDLKDNLKIISAVKLDTVYGINSGTGKQELLTYIRSADSGDIYQVPTPYFDDSRDSHQVPESVKYIQERIFPLLEAVRLPVAD